MRRLVHLSDLHFGRVDERIAQAILHDITSLRPHFAAVSGDLTQRARNSQFEAAANFLRKLPCPFIAVPGNHDIPLYRLTSRWLQPLRGYRRHIHEETDPIYVDHDMIVAGWNTATRWRWTEGRIRRKQVIALQSAMTRTDATKAVRIIVMHHPPEDGWTALDRFASLKPDLILSGHLHQAGAKVHAQGAVLIGAGTATSTRLRGSSNAYNVIDVDRNDGISKVIITTRVWTGQEFQAEHVSHFEGANGKWSQISTPKVSSESAITQGSASSTDFNFCPVE